MASIHFLHQTNKASDILYALAAINRSHLRIFNKKIVRKYNRISAKLKETVIGMLFIRLLDSDDTVNYKLTLLVKNTQMLKLRCWMQL